MANQTLLFLKTTTEKAHALLEDLQSDGFSFQPLFRARMIVENADLAAIQEWFLERGIDSMYAPSLCAVTEAEETFHVHPSYFRLSESEALLYQYIMAKHDFSALDIDVRNLDNAVLDLVQKEEKTFCKENGIYGNYSWDEYASPFLSSGAARLQAVLKVKILNAKGYRQVKDGKVDYAKDIYISRFVYVRKEEPKKKSLAQKIATAKAEAGNRETREGCAVAEIPFDERIQAASDRVVESRSLDSMSVKAPAENR